MAIVPDESSTSASEVDFGANDWLLEEMYERYTTDPSSVDETWADYFKSHAAPSTGAGDGAAAETPEPKPEAASEQPASRGEPTPTAAGPAPAPAQAPPAAQPPPEPSASRRAPTVEKPAPTKEIRPSAPGARGGIPADPPSPDNRPSGALGRASQVHHAGDSGTYCKEHGHLLDRAYRDQRSVATGQVAHRPARGDQQPPAPGARRQGLVHPHHWLRHGAGSEDSSSHEQRL